MVRGRARRARGGLLALDLALLVAPQLAPAPRRLLELLQIELAVVVLVELVEGPEQELREVRVVVADERRVDLRVRQLAVLREDVEAREHLLGEHAVVVVERVLLVHLLPEPLALLGLVGETPRLRLLEGHLGRRHGQRRALGVVDGLLVVVDRRRRDAGRVARAAAEERVFLRAAAVVARVVVAAPAGARRRRHVDELAVRRHAVREEGALGGLGALLGRRLLRRARVLDQAVLGRAPELAPQERGQDVRLAAGVPQLDLDVLGHGQRPEGVRGRPRVRRQRQRPRELALEHGPVRVARVLDDVLAHGHELEARVRVRRHGGRAVEDDVDRVGAAAARGRERVRVAARHAAEHGVAAELELAQRVEAEPEARLRREVRLRGQVAPDGRAVLGRDLRRRDRRRRVARLRRPRVALLHGLDLGVAEGPQERLARAVAQGEVAHGALGAQALAQALDPPQGQRRVPRLAAVRRHLFIGVVAFFPVGDAQRRPARSGRPIAP